MFIRILILISIVAVVASFAINMIFTSDSRWSILVAAGVLCMWISLFFIIRRSIILQRLYYGRLNNQRTFIYMG